MCRYTVCMRVYLMGTGTSHGIPVISCNCKVCRSHNSKDKRMRCSAFAVQKNADGTETCILIDIGPEFRIQALKTNIKSLNALLLTHSHADHLDGLDDIRVFSHTKSSMCARNPAKYGESPGAGLRVYGNAGTLKDVRTRFDYIFKETQIGGGKPKLDLEDCAGFNGENPLVIGGISVVPVPMKHGIVDTTGWLLRCTGKDGKIHSTAYLTDCNEIPESSVKIITKYGGIIDNIVIDGLREEPHSTHFSYLQAMECAAKLGGKRVWLTHICHNMSHKDITEYCKRHQKDFPGLAKVRPAYDGLILTAGK